MEKSKLDITFKFISKKQEKELDQIRDSWNGNGVPPIVTKQLEMMIKSVAGNKDLMNIRNFIENMPITEAIPDETQALKYKLITLPKNTTYIPVINVGNSSIILAAAGNSSSTWLILPLALGCRSSIVLVCADDATVCTVSGLLFLLPG